MASDILILRQFGNDMIRGNKKITAKTLLANPEFVCIRSKHKMATLLSRMRYERLMYTSDEPKDPK
jgi:hypothetical protein